MLSTGLKCFQQSWNIFVQSQNVMYRVGMLATGFECVLEGWNTFVQGWNTFVQGWNTFYRVGMLPTGLE
jgi:hypothetical protein